MNTNGDDETSNTVLQFDLHLDTIDEEALAVIHPWRHVT